MAKRERGRSFGLALFALQLRRPRGSRRQMNERHQFIAVDDESGAAAPPRDHVISMLGVVISVICERDQFVARGCRELP